jgi:hypothetical protein
MNLRAPFSPSHHFFAPEHGGSGVAGGGHPADSSVPPEEAIDDALGYAVTGHGKTAGTADPGVPGTWTNPVESGQSTPTHEEIAALAYSFWLEEKQPEGKADEHWARAVAQLNRR